MASDTDGDKTTTILVGPEEHRFEVSKHLLCSKSEYFARAYKAGFREASEDVFRLDDVHPYTFGIFATWLRTGKVCPNPEDETTSLPCLPRKHLYRNDLWPDHDADYDPNEDMMSDTESLPESESSVDLVDDLSDPTEDSEADHLLQRVGASNADELDVYQLEVMIKLSEVDTECEKWRPKWQVLLARKTSAIGKEETTSAITSFQASDDDTYVNNDIHLEDHDADIYSPLIGLYILADRFDIRTLRSAVVLRLQVEYEEQLHILGGRPLPTYELVVEAYENLPSSSRLRRWMAAVYAANWTPAHDDPEQAAKRGCLPKEFLMDVMLLKSEQMFWTVSGYRPLELLDLCFYHEHETAEEISACQAARGLQECLGGLMKEYLGQY